MKSKWKTNNLSKRKNQVKMLIAMFNKVAQDVETLNGTFMYVMPQLKKHMESLANLLENIQSEIQTELKLLES